MRNRILLFIFHFIIELLISFYWETFIFLVRWHFGFSDLSKNIFVLSYTVIHWCLSTFGVLFCCVVSNGVFDILMRN